MYSTTQPAKCALNHNLTRLLLLVLHIMSTCDRIWKDVGSNPGPYTEYAKNSCDINLGPIDIKNSLWYMVLCHHSLTDKQLLSVNYHIPLM